MVYEYNYHSSITCRHHPGMLNLQNIPNNEISGLDTDVLNWVTIESSERYINEISDDFFEAFEQ